MVLPAGLRVVQVSSFGEKALVGGYKQGWLVGWLVGWPHSFVHQNACVVSRFDCQHTSFWIELGGACNGTRVQLFVRAFVRTLECDYTVTSHASPIDRLLALVLPRPCGCAIRGFFPRATLQRYQYICWFDRCYFGQKKIDNFVVVVFETQRVAAAS